MHRPRVTPLPQTSSGWWQQGAPQKQLRERPDQGPGHIPEQVVHTSTPPPTIQKSTTYNAPLEPLVWELGSLPDTPTSMPLSQESLAATSKAAQHWRKSWLDRQHAEVGPAVGVSRGQASVPEPLMAMQHSLVRMRAIMLQKNAKDGKGSSLGFWLAVIMLFCLISGLSAYIISTYLPSIQLSTTLVSSNLHPQPTLMMKDAKKTTVTTGQPIQIHGEHFGQSDTILFILGETPLSDAGGKPILTQSNSKGAFDAIIPIQSTQLAGEYALQAQDKHTGQHAFLDIQITASTNTDVLKLSLSSLSFSAVVGYQNPDGQSVSITNTSNAAIQWKATTISDNQTGWLLLDDGKTSGQLDVGQTDTIRISAFTMGLKSSAKNKPYTGTVIFTIPDQGQVILPVSLEVLETTVELLITPNPLTALASPGGCQNTTLTLINLSSTAVSWEVKTDDFSQQHITLDGKADEKEQLLPSGSPNDTKVIKIGCNGVQLDKVYSVTVYYNGDQQQIPITITRG
ncbi:MAG: hypothetical protein NVS4B11_30040 [Ktedonobacteraceae bacterium]